MKILDGKYNFAKVMIDEIDDNTQAQIQGFLNHPAFGNKKKIAIMPDCHAGSGSCIGFTMRFNEIPDAVMPQIVGVDIGCGMLAACFGNIELDPVKLDAFIKENIPAGRCINDKPFEFIEEFRDKVETVSSRIGAGYAQVSRAIGSLGGGNHFIEADHDSQGRVWIVIHSGSRNFGKRIADFYQKNARNLMDAFYIDFEKDMEFIPSGQPTALEYVNAMKIAQEYARINRYEMLHRIGRFIIEGVPSAGMTEVVESVHNYIDFKDHTIRKGAISAHEGEICIIPFNSADGSALCKGKGNKEWNESAPHGAGRLMSRSKAFENLDYKEYQARLAEKGVYSSTANSSTLDEAPMAYKPMETILSAIEPTVEIVDMLKPFYNFKAAEGRGRK